MDKLPFIKAAGTCLSNGRSLLYNAESLSDAQQWGTCFALATIAQEEFAKAFLLFLVSKDAISWNSLIYRAGRDHTCKQLLGLVMAYISPDFDESFKRDMDWLREHEERKALFVAYKSSVDPAERDQIWRRIQEISTKEGSLPKSVADAIDILRYEKIDRWQSSTWMWADTPVYDKMAKRLGDGKLDREKQDALYVRLGKNGEVVRTPGQVKNKDATAAKDVARRLLVLVEGLLSHNDYGGFEYKKVESAIKIVFRNLSRANPPRNRHPKNHHEL